MRRTPLLVCVFVASLFCTRSAAAQATPPDPVAPQPTVSHEVDLMLIDMPTTLSLKKHRSYFRLTHRFARDLRRGDFGDLAADLFSLDNGAVMGLEYRFGITSSLQAGIHRTTLSKTIVTFARWDAFRQGNTMPISLSVSGSVEGIDNMKRNYQPGLAITVSHTIGRVVSLYATPAFVANTRAVDFVDAHEGHDHGDIGTGIDEHIHHKDTMMLGLGARARIRPTVSIAGEWVPRVAWYDPNASTWGVAIEKETRGHVLQLNFTNQFGTTPGELARGGSVHDVYLGFNLTRKF